jgi:hypothetical protein
MTMPSDETRCANCLAPREAVFHDPCVPGALNGSHDPDGFCGSLTCHPFVAPSAPPAEVECNTDYGIEGVGLPPLQCDCHKDGDPRHCSKCIKHSWGKAGARPAEVENFCPNCFEPLPEGVVNPHWQPPNVMGGAFVCKRVSWRDARRPADPSVSENGSRQPEREMTYRMTDEAAWESGSAFKVVIEQERARKAISPEADALAWKIWRAAFRAGAAYEAGRRGR